MAQTFKHLKSHTRLLMINPPFHLDISPAHYSLDTCPSSPHLYIQTQPTSIPLTFQQLSVLAHSQFSFFTTRETKMSQELQKPSPESLSSGLHFDDTELTLGLPGATKSGTKRGFSDTVDLNLRSLCNADQARNPSENDVSGESKPPPAK